MHQWQIDLLGLAPRLLSFHFYEQGRAGLRLLYERRKNSEMEYRKVLVHTTNSRKVVVNDGEHFVSRQILNLIIL